MSEAAEFRDPLERFLKGETSFSDLTAAIGDRLHSAPDSASAYRAYLDRLVNEGRLSLHLYGVLRQIRAEPADRTATQRRAASRAGALGELLGQGADDAAPAAEPTPAEPLTDRRREAPIALVARPSERLLGDAPLPARPGPADRPAPPPDPTLSALLAPSAGGAAPDGGREGRRSRGADGDEDGTIRMAAARREASSDASPADDREGHEPADRVGNAVLDDYLRGFNRYRDKSDVQPDSGRDRQLDALLEDWRSMRYRHDARRAEAGESHRAKPFDFASAGAADLAPGRLLKDRFVLEERLGQGGMGVVFKAVDRRKLEVRARSPYVALKVVRDDFQQPEAFQALEREARKAQALAHPNIINVFDFDRDGGVVFLTMELLDGRPLSRVVRDLHGVGMPWPRARPIVSGMARGLGHAHAHGVIHADFKPANVFLDDRGKVTVLDFGIARAGLAAAEDARADDGIAQAMGALTPAYASCEMLEDKDPDPRDDIYGLACVTYELLAGHHPFRRRPATEARDAGTRPRPIPGLTRGQTAALERALAFDRDARTPTAEAFLAELESAGAPRRRWWPVAVAGVIVLGLAGAAVWAVHSRPAWLEPVLARLSPQTGGAPERSAPSPAVGAPEAVVFYSDLIGTGIGDAVATLDFRPIEAALVELRARVPAEPALDGLEDLVQQARILAVRAALARRAEPPSDRLAALLDSIGAASPSDRTALERKIARGR